MRERDTAEPKITEPAQPLDRMVGNVPSIDRDGIQAIGFGAVKLDEQDLRKAKRLGMTAQQYAEYLISDIP